MEFIVEKIGMNRTVTVRLFPVENSELICLNKLLYLSRLIFKTRKRPPKKGSFIFLYF